MALCCPAIGKKTNILLEKYVAVTTFTTIHNTPQINIYFVHWYFPQSHTHTPGYATSSLTMNGCFTHICFYRLFLSSVFFFHFTAMQCKSMHTRWHLLVQWWFLLLCLSSGLHGNNVWRWVIFRMHATVSAAGITMDMGQATMMMTTTTTTTTHSNNSKCLQGFWLDIIYKWPANSYKICREII